MPRMVQFCRLRILNARKHILILESTKLNYRGRDWNISQCVSPKGSDEVLMKYWGYDSGLTLGRDGNKKLRGKSHLHRTRFHFYWGSTKSRKISGLKIPSSLIC